MSSGADTAETSSTSLEGKLSVSIEESLRAHGSKNVKFVDGSWFLKDRDAKEEYEAGPRIAGAQYFDIDDICDSQHPKSLPHMMPSKIVFACAMDEMSISNDDHIILYGTAGCMIIHRAWFQIRNMGHERIHLLDGNMDDWKEAGGPMEEGPRKVFRIADLDLSKPPKYQANDPINIVDMQGMLDIIDGKREGIIVDVRAAERFRGEVEEPRPNMRLGHMPGSLNMPFNELLDPENMVRLRSKEEVKKRLEEAGIDVNTEKPIVASCGSGATACTLVAALDLVGRDPSLNYVYDGSWSEWGGEDNTPIIKGSGDREAELRDRGANLP